MPESDYLQRSKGYKGYHYSVLEPAALEYLHRRTLEMFWQVKDIFDRNGIEYMICGGTLLGAEGGVMDISFPGMMIWMCASLKRTMIKQFNV